jgi:hypothetical protein
MKTFLLIIPICAAMLFMTSCAAPFAPFPLSPGGYSSSSASGIDQTTLNAIDQNNLNNDSANLQQSQAAVQP